jgi:hypothetical protein
LTMALTIWCLGSLPNPGQQSEPGSQATGLFSIRAAAQAVPSVHQNSRVHTDEPSSDESQQPVPEGTAQATEELAVDDGSFENSIGYPSGDPSAYFVNRLTPRRYPATLTTVRIFFEASPFALASGSPITILVGTNPGGRSRIDGVRFQRHSRVINSRGAFNDYPVEPVTISSGDFVVGFVVRNPINTYPAAYDETAPRARSYTSTDGFIFSTMEEFLSVPPGNLGIRARVTSGPEIEVTPASLDFGRVMVGQSADRAFTVRNTGAAPLPVSSVSSNNPAFHIVSPAALVGEDLMADDGTFEGATRPSQASTIYCVNRLTPTRYPATLSEVRIFFPGGNSGLQAGRTFGLLVGTNPDGDINIDGTTFEMTSAMVRALDEVNLYDVPDVTIPSGDFVVGFRMTVGANVSPCALDTSSPWQQRSYVSTDGTRFTNNPGANLVGNFGIRAHVGSLLIAPGGQQVVTARFVPTVGGVQTGVLSVTNTDPDEPTVAVQVRGEGVGAPSAPDFVVRNLIILPTNPAPGEAIRVSFTILNEGLAAAPRATHAVVLSSDNVIDASDQLLTLVDTPSVPAGGSSNVSVTVTIPGGTPAGTRFIIVIADVENAVMESNEGNNTAAAMITVGTGQVLTHVTKDEKAVSVPPSAVSQKLRADG